jgi:hypothetical protein
MMHDEKPLIALLLLMIGLIILSALWALQVLDTVLWLIAFTV